MSSVVECPSSYRRKQKPSLRLLRGDCAIDRTASGSYVLADSRLFDSAGTTIATLHDGDWYDAEDGLPVAEIRLEHLQRVEFHRASGALQWLPCQRVAIYSDHVEAQGNVIALRVDGTWRTNTAELPICPELRIR